ncbi:hypothetical protein GGX14DRAFT_431163 [Mycena pura]|uniref:Uncharacterized protein n=1 Tax=Mycena pura TaxID=153505 RepID=A0AAD6VRD1_9AGAR|nr:hypothetical protein GGX14DRAFT_431163 [Mycena pura]
MTSRTTKATSSHNDDLSKAYSNLSSLGAPVTLEELTSLYSGPLADALRFLSEHIVGRQAASAGRVSLLLSQEQRLTSKLKQPDTTRSAADKAVARHTSANKTFALYTNELANCQEKLHTTSLQARALQKKMDEKRRLLVLLRVFESKQRLRMQRIEALTRAIEGEKQTVSESQKQPFPTVNAAQMPLQTQLWRISHARDCIAYIHSYHIRLSRFVETPGTGDGMLLLRQVVSRNLRKDPSHPDTNEALDRCISVACRLAADKLLPKFPNDSLNRCELDTKRRYNKEKELRLQKLSELSTALGLLCDHHATSISNFINILSNRLEQAIQEECRLSKNHVEILRYSMAEKPAKSTGESFKSRVIEACRMRGNV